MNVSQIYAFLSEKFPPETAADFDNVGLLVGDLKQEVRRCVVALDCTDSAIDYAVRQQAQLIVTHHPVIFHPIRSVTARGLPFRLIRNGLSVVSMHTNLDTADGGVNDVLGETIGLTDLKKLTTPDGFSIRIGQLTRPMSSSDFAALLAKRLNTVVRYAGSKTIQTVGLCSGSGADYYDCAIAAGADAFVTAEVKHHQFLAARQAGVPIFDAGHFETEVEIVPALCRLLTERFPGLDCLAFQSREIEIEVCGSHGH